MGRTYIVEESVGQYLSNISLQGKAFVSEEQNENLKHPKVSRMLPGGLLVLGVFIITTLELAHDFQNALRRLIFAMEKSMNRKRMWNFTEEEISEQVILHISRPANWKYQSGLSTSWLSLDCTIHIDIHIPLSSTSNGLPHWAKQIENDVYLINGQVKNEDCDLLEGQKKSFRGNTQATSHSFDVSVLTQLLLNSDHRSTATVPICSGSVNLKGSVKCRAYIHSNKPKVKDAMQAVKREILNTVADGCEILFEDLLLNEIPEKKDSEKEFYILPHRVFVPIPGSTVKLCDYKFGDESAEEIRDHFIEMLDHMVQIEDLEIAEEVNTACMSSMNNEASLEHKDDKQLEQPIETTVMLKIRQNIGVIAAFAVAVLAAGISFHYFSD
ncbi:ODR4-like [Ictidomys tridecemlineatus]|uniref:Protein odr-4 homolog n=1 Tax=Ictidomys tridecemlineatus TaxID=43179 RepID=A0A287CVR3_ICTTR|nr:ODR4-like [Ictidomys tridecemlineatus]